MKLTKKTITIVLVTLMVVATMSFAPPIAAQTACAELLQVKPKWRHLDLSKNPWQILYAKVKNNCTEPVWVRVEFVVQNGEGINVYISEEVFLPVHPPKPLLLEVTFEVGIPGKYYVAGVLFYKAEGAEWIMDGIIRSIKPSFIAV
jgi:hypothetical protein